MSDSADDEILQDFLIEAGEILEKLNGQLVEMEQRPDDRDLLNAVFRSFHTVKGGASFLSLTPLVEVCHRAEDVFNVLRNGQRQVDAHLMDAVLRVLDIVNDMFAQIQNGEEMVPAEPELLSLLETLAQPGGESTAESAAPAAAPTPAPADGDITDAEFEALLDAVQEPAPAATAPAPATSAASDDITDDDFEKLLDELHGGKPIGVTTTAPAAGQTAAASATNEMTDDDFEKLLDDLHGGKPPGQVAAGAAPPPPPPPPAVIAQPVAAAPPPPPPPTSPPAAVKPSAAPQPPAAETTVRVDTKRLDVIMNLVGELVLVRNRLSTLKAAMNDEQLAKAVGNLDLVTADLQSAVMKTRMQPIKKVFGRFPRVVRDLARSLKKEVNLETVGEETDLDKNLVEALADPLVHLVRNSVDHGVEMPDVREKAGKPRAGTVVLAAEQEGDHIVLTIEDDGGGMDAEVLRRKVVEKGLMDEDSAARLDDRDCYNLIFMPGFSTKTEISDVSGRGVGMDVVKTRITQLNGTVEIDSKKGRGTIIRIKVPLTLAIMPTLMVKVDSRTFALPLSSVSEIFPLDTTHTNRIDGQLVVMVRDRAMPLFYLWRWLSPSHNEQGSGQVVMVHVGGQRVGFVVDQVLGQEEVVIKPLGTMLQGMPGFSGATITGDGRIALILDVPSLMKAYARRM